MALFFFCLAAAHEQHRSSEIVPAQAPRWAVAVGGGGQHRDAPSVPTAAPASPPTSSRSPPGHVCSLFQYCSLTASKLLLLLAAAPMLVPLRAASYSSWGGAASEPAARRSQHTAGGELRAGGDVQGSVGGLLGRNRSPAGSTSFSASTRSAAPTHARTRCELHAPPASVASAHAFLPPPSVVLYPHPPNPPAAVRPSVLRPPRVSTAPARPAAHDSRPLVAG